MTDPDLKRTQEEILERFELYNDLNNRDRHGDPHDGMGFKREVLLDYLDFEHARPYLKDDATQQEWDQAHSRETLRQAAEGYYDFALGKIEDHRGLSAMRSVDKLETYAWLLGRDDVVQAMSEAPYPQYGAPRVKAYADGLGLLWPIDELYTRMAAGQPCEDDCEMGCDR